MWSPIRTDGDVFRVAGNLWLIGNETASKNSAITLVVMLGCWKDRVGRRGQFSLETHDNF